MKLESIADFVVLAVEDQTPALKVLQMSLKELGINQIFTAEDGYEALQFLGSCGDLVNIVICDWNMPKMTGIELLTQIRSVDPLVPFLMITGRADHESVMEAKVNGVSGFIAKPYSVDELEKKLRYLQTVASDWIPPEEAFG
jgi:two-component system chemotaxis response regulator CheY